jgi:hypothetical protein
LPGLNGSEIFLYLFPYRVLKRIVDRVIDLRLPDVREWFYRTFRIPTDAADAHTVDFALANLNPTIAHSRFHFENGVAPVPDSFWAMLPTLVNPDLGGGSPADTGSSLLMVGHWMRQHNTAALVFPSARCDAAAVFESGTLKNWQGWNFVDFGDAPLFGYRGTHVTTFVMSPWAWVKFPAGVRLHVPPIPRLLP